MGLVISFLEVSDEVIKEDAECAEGFKDDLGGIILEGDGINIVKESFSVVDDSGFIDE